MTIPGRGDLAPRRRRRRGRWGRRLLTLVVLAAVAAGVWYGYDRWTGGDTGADVVVTPCVTPSHPPTPAAAKDVRLRVLNGTKRVGLAHRVANQLHRRGFRVTRIGNSPSGTATTTVTYTGNETGALAVAEQLPGDVPVTSTGANGPLALVLGLDFRRLATPVEAAAHRTADQRAAAPSPPPCATTP